MPTKRSVPLAEAAFVVVDVETTGLSPVHNRVIEVCALRVRGGTIGERFSTLIDPGTSVPPDIVRLTGITRAMLDGQPTFAGVGPALAQFLGADPFVAHNATFDYSFLREEFRRSDSSYSATTLCTARLGRRLLPSLRRANLDALLLALDEPGRAGHRAEQDAAATAAAFLKLLALAQQQGVTTLAELVRRQSAGGALRTADLAARVRQLPAAPGVYCFRNGDGQVVYVGKATNLRRRVQSHFRAGAREPHRLRRVLGSVETIDHIETGSELEALLLESRLIKQYLPAGNQAQRDYHQYPYLRLGTDEPVPRLSVTRTVAGDGATYYGPFRRANPVQSAVVVLQERFRLPRCAGPIIPGHTPICIYGQMGRCLAPCSGPTGAAEYASVVDHLKCFLGAGDGGLINDLEERRDEMAEALRFEEAAELRDAADELRMLFGAQWRLSTALHDCHAIILAASLEAGAVELFAIRSGLLLAQRRLRPGDLPLELLERWLSDIYAGETLADACHVRNDQLDELHIIAGWLRRGGGRHLTIPIVPAQAAAAAAPLADAILGFDLLTASQAAAPDEAVE
ncbi:MAG TPA: exonuclease domain-containing protein [Chloroflexota bacterium]|nr:exonuclease domain-containing protein [Chloroflexota bacterium]